MATKEIKINRFVSIGEDKRNLPEGQFYYLENVDAGNFDSQLKQVVNVSTHTNDQCIIKLIRYNGVNYGLGFDNTTNKDVTLYSGTAGSYTALTNGTVSSTTLALTNPMLGVLDGVIYFDAGNNYVGKYVISTTTMTATWQSITGGMSGGTNWQGNLYCFDRATKTTVYKLTSSGITSMVSVPADQTIVELIPFGDYLAIIATPSSTSGDGVAKMRLWDGIKTTTFDEIVDIGYGTVTGGDVLDGQIYTVISFPNNKGFRIKVYNGGIFSTVFTYYGKRNESSTYEYMIPASTIKAYTGYLYFIAVGSRPGSSYADIYEPVLFRYGRRGFGQTNKLSVYKSLEVQPAEGVVLGSNYHDFIVIEDNSYPTASDLSIEAVIYESSYVSRQVKSTASTYTAQPGVIETGYISFGEPGRKFQIDKVSCSFEPLPSAGQVIVKYKADNESSWTTLFTETTDNKTTHIATNVESTGAPLPQTEEIRFRIELTGNAVITGFKVKATELLNAY